MIRLYHSPRTRSVRIVWLLEELGLPYELKTMAFTPEELKAPEYLKVHPLGKIPVIQDGDVIMFESGAIVEYIIERYGNGRLAPKPATPQRAPFLQWLHFGEAALMPPLGHIAQHTLFKPEAERIPALVKEAFTMLASLLQTVDAALEGRQFIAGDEFSGADVMMAYGLLLAKWFGALNEQHPNAQAYLARLEARPALQKALSS